MKLVIECIDIISLVVYFFVSFTTGAWHSTWIIFLIAAAVNTIVKLLFSFNKDEVIEDEQDN